MWKSKKQTTLNSDKELKELVSLINKTHSVSLFRSSIAERSLTFLKGKVDGLFDGLRDVRKNGTRQATNSLSKVFGNAVGLIEFRKGFLYKKQEPHDTIEKNLKPLDIMFEKTPFRPTDRFIPGHWGHVAIWIGSLQKTKRFGTLGISN